MSKCARCQLEAPRGAKACQRCQWPLGSAASGADGPDGPDGAAGAAGAAAPGGLGALSSQRRWAALSVSALVLGGALTAGLISRNHNSSVAAGGTASTTIPTITGPIHHTGPVHKSHKPGVPTTTPTQGSTTAPFSPGGPAGTVTTTTVASTTTVPGLIDTTAATPGSGPGAVVASADPASGAIAASPADGSGNTTAATPAGQTPTPAPSSPTNTTPGDATTTTLAPPTPASWFAAHMIDYQQMVRATDTVVEDLVLTTTSSAQTALDLNNSETKTAAMQADLPSSTLIDPAMLAAIKEFRLADTQLANYQDNGGCAAAFERANYTNQVNSGLVGIYTALSANGVSDTSLAVPFDPTYPTMVAPDLNNLVEVPGTAPQTAKALTMQARTFTIGATTTTTLAVTTPDTTVPGTTPPTGSTPTTIPVDANSVVQACSAPAATTANGMRA